MSHREDGICRGTSLPDRGVLRVSGADAKTFLQGLLTNDIEKTDGGGAIHAGLLSPHGKILHDFFVLGCGDGYLIEAPAESIEALAKRLSFYKLRSKVAIDAEPAMRVAAVWGGQPALPDGALAYADPRLPELGFRVLLPEGTVLDEAACPPATEADYHARRIALGIPQGGRDYAYGDTFPHEALYDQLDGVAFKKGCYVGQEVVSRMQHRGTVRKRVVPVEGDGALEVGAEVVAGNVPAGSIGSADGTHGLALLRLDRAASAQAQGKPLKAGDTTITVRLPDYATFEMPVAEGV
ncbi:hypothetical protein AUC68_14100 [Methyloceanibacter methanicus]|uniref:CAF17 C-terminal domain-containing protein n=1 Tax=Methyloceanibacter methanicus TaxID=1774968 RepID=A0A1E3W4I4_9HYPH|nr:folate-binding protein YgfZ [Methyloceanibacter methanicus]ODS00713.1 hypothetical protein AUC68_14100 [Methyloceanibacter methanicus]